MAKPSKSKLKKVGTAKAVLLTIDIEAIEEKGLKAIMYSDFREEPEGTCGWCLEKGPAHTGKKRECPDGGNIFLPTDPRRMADNLRKSIEGDWPKHTHTIVGNDRADYLAWKRRMAQMGMDGSVESYLEIA